MKITLAKGALQDELAKMAANLLNKKLREVSGPFCLLLSGGSAFSILEYLDTSIFNQDSIIGVLDERYSLDPRINNFTQLTQTTFFKTIAHKVRAINTRVMPDESADQLAIRFDKELQTICAAHVPIYATIGIGADGHVSGIMPFPENAELFNKTFYKTDKLVTYYSAAGKNEFAERVTTTLPLMRKIIYAVGIVYGDNKKDALSKLVREDGAIALSPSRILKEMLEVDIVTDIDL